MTTTEERVAALEQLSQQGREEHKDIADTLEKLTAQVSKLEVYLANGNNAPFGIAWDGAYFYVVDYSGDKVYVYDADGTHVG